VFFASLTKGKLFSEDFLVLSENNHILFESALLKQDVLEKNGILDRLWQPTSRPVSGTYNLLGTPWSGTFYYHWLLDALPRLSLLEELPEFREYPLVVPKNLQAFHLDSLEMAGVSERSLVRFDNECWQVERLIFPGLLSITGSPSPHAVEWLRRRFLKVAASMSKPERLIYVTRRDAAKRRLLNEEEIIAYVTRLGFEVVCPGELSFSEQIRLFAGARVVIGPHGAGFTNMVFAPVDATLVEFFGDNYMNGCFWALTNILGQTHAFVSSPTEILDYSIPLERVKAILGKLGIG
jgi:capsular polysaccharide biosynthesis protein